MASNVGKSRNLVETHAIVAIILAVGIAVAVILLTVETILHSGTVTEQEASLLSTVLGAIVGAVATYLGVSKREDDKNGGNSDDETPNS